MLIWAFWVEEILNSKKEKENLFSIPMQSSKSFHAELIGVPKIPNVDTNNYTWQFSKPYDSLFTAFLKKLHILVSQGFFGIYSKLWSTFR